MAENTHGSTSHRSRSLVGKPDELRCGFSRGVTELRRSLGRSHLDVRNRRRLSLFCAAGALIISCFGMLMIRSAVGRDHLRSVDDYLANNFIKMEKDSDGNAHIWGSKGGNDFDYTENGTYCPGVTVNGVSIGGMTYQEARSVLLDEISRELLAINMCVTVDDVSITLTSASFTINTDLDEILHEAFILGRESEDDPYANYVSRMRVESEGAEFSCLLVLDESTVAERVDAIAAVIDREAVEPYISLKNRVGGGKPGIGTGGPADDVFDTETIYAPDGTPIADIICHNGANGRALNRERMCENIIEAFNAGDYDSSIAAEFTEVTFTGSAEALKGSIVELASFSTGFKSSSINRARNVQKANAMLNCIIMQPGEELSYNELLGPRTEADGWLPAPGISGGKEYIDSPGGGICQISSTLYNALLLVGDRAKIVRRYHHSIPGSYVPLGLDATVSMGGPDFVWTAVGSPLYLLTYTDMRNRIAYAYIYGDALSGGSTYRVWSETVSEMEPPTPLWIPEPLWPAGYSEDTVTERKGYIVDIYRQEIGPDGEPVSEPERLYQDVYSAVQGEIHYGTGDPTLPEP